MINKVFSSNKMNLLVVELSKIVVRHLENMFIAIVFTKNYPACHTDENGIKPGSNFHTADKCVANPSQDEYLGIKQSVFDV